MLIQMSFFFPHFVAFLSDCADSQQKTKVLVLLAPSRACRELAEPASAPTPRHCHMPVLLKLLKNIKQKEETLG